MHFHVDDTGIGIPEEKVAEIFDAFVQADGTTTRQYGGTGLGLAISSQLVEMMGGKIWVESQEGQGSQFHVTAYLGIDRRPGSPESTQDSAGSEGARRDRPLRILVAEDDAINQSVAVGLLENMGHVVEAADNGRQAVERVLEKTYDLVFMDIQMPDMDGFDAVDQIRASEDKAKREIPIAAITAHAMHGDRERCLERGIESLCFQTR
jgi:CheY-like chemotaxis protein